MGGSRKVRAKVVGVVPPTVRPPPPSGVAPASFRRRVWKRVPQSTPGRGAVKKAYEVVGGLGRVAAWAGTATSPAVMVAAAVRMTARRRMGPPGWSVKVIGGS